MKKRKIITLTLVVALLLLGVGYAQWSDFVTINSNVSTGLLEVKVYATTSHELQYFYDPSNLYGDRYLNLSAAPTADNKSYNVTIGNLYPGAEANYTYTIKNTGTLPARLTGLNVAFDNPDSDLINYIYTYSGFHKYNANGDLQRSQTIYVNGPLSTMSSQYATALSQLNLVLWPNEYVIVSMPSDASVKYMTGCRYVLSSNAPQSVQDMDLTITITPSFEKAN